jgi:hypothetical protein
MIDVAKSHQEVGRGNQRMTQRRHKKHAQSSVPTYDYLEHRSLDNQGDLEWLVEDFVHDVETGYFLQWEAVIRQEQGLLLSRKQQERLNGLINFGNPSSRILYIDEMPRPAETWYQIVRKIVPKLLLEKVITSESQYLVAFEGWPKLVKCLEAHGQDLSRPEGVTSPIDVVPVHLQHQLWLQVCFDRLSGLGQEEELTLEREDQADRIPWFIADLRAHKVSVQFLDLTLGKLLTIVILPPKDEVILVQAMLKDLGLASTQTPLADGL